jgi:hypothetical protein
MTNKNKKIMAGIFVATISINAHADTGNPAFELGTMIGTSIGNGISSLFSSSDEKKLDPKNEVASQDTNSSSGGIGGFFSSIFKGPTPEEILAKASDKEMTKAFLDVQKTNKKLTFSQNSNVMTFNNVVVPFDSAHTFGQARSLCAGIDTVNDSIAEEYKKVVTERGNYFTVYNGTVNASIQNAVFGQLAPSNGNDEYYKYDFDNAIVEYAPDGTIVSALTRMEKISLNMMIRPNDINYYNIEIAQISRIYAQPRLSVVSRIVSKRLFDDNLVMTSKQEPKQALPVVASIEQDSTTKLKSLFELYKAGALTKEEFDSAKKQILTSVK